MAATQERSLFDMPIDDIEFKCLGQFFALEFRQNERIDYKEARPDTGRPDSVRVAKTIGAMSNTRGGIVFLGVAENKRKKTPESWEGILMPDPIGWVMNVCHAYITPVVFPEVKPCRNEKTDCDVVFIRVPVGQNQPYSVKDKGVLVRIGNQNRIADLPTLERLFRRKIEPNTQLERLERLQAQQDVSTGKPDKPSQLVVNIVPRYDEFLPIRMGSNLDNMLFKVAKEMIRERHPLRTELPLEKTIGSTTRALFDSRTEDQTDELSLDKNAALVSRSYFQKQENGRWILMVYLRNWRRKFTTFLI